MEHLKEATKTSDRELVLTRIFNAPRALVYKAWTDPAHLINWWGPKGFTNTFHELDIRPGGTWRFIMHGPDGTNYPNVIVFDEVVAQERLVYAHGSGDENHPGFHVTVLFEDEGDKTKLTMRSIFASAAMLQHLIEEFGVLEGGNQTLDRLAEELTKMA